MLNRLREQARSYSGLCGQKDLLKPLNQWGSCVGQKDLLTLATTVALHTSS
jgi:hypothetical protein